MSETERIFYFDVLRAMAIIGIVFCHASVYFIPSNLNNSNLYIVAFFDCFRDFSIPIFVMLSGILLLNRKESFVKFFKKRLSRLLIPFIFWVIIYVAYTNSFTLSNILNITFGMSGSIGVTFWFIWMIIIMYIAIFIINKTIEYGNKSTDNFTNKLIKILTFTSLIYFFVIYMGWINPYLSKSIYYFSFVTYIIFGYFIANNDYIGSRISKNKIMLITSITSISIYLYYICAFVVLRSFTFDTFIYLGYFNPLLLILSVNIFVFFKYLSKSEFMNKLEKNIFGKFIKTISKYSFGIYLVHYLIIQIIKSNILIFIQNPNPLIWILITVIITLIISLVILWILSKIHILNKVSGIN